MASAAYEFDLAGNVTKATLDDSLTYKGDATVTYLYDAVNRLTKESCAKAAGSYRTEYDYSYWYDAVGNRTKMQTGAGTTTYLYTARNELTKATVGGNDTLYTYDLRANLTKKGSVEYSWDSQDHMTKVVNGNTTVEFKYDLLGRRVAKRVNAGDWWWYFYDGLKVLAEGSNTSTNRVFYTLGPDDIGGILYRDRYGTKYAYHYDRLGNVMAVTDKDGAAYAVYTMDAFGNVLEKGTSTGYSSEHATDPQPYHLTTKEYDPDVGLYYFNARWYDPLTGRFVSRERVVSGGGYSFCEGNPVTYRDPDGTAKKKPKTDPEVERLAKEVKDKCKDEPLPTGEPPNAPRHCASPEACCQAIHALLAYAWQDVNPLFGFLFGSPHVSNRQCMTACTCENNQQGKAKSGRDIFTDYMKCMAKWQLTLNPWTWPGLPPNVPE